MKYDDASWHYSGDFPDELSPEAGATHIGMFVAWCMLNGLSGNLHTDEFPDELKELMSRKVTPGQFLINACDEKFTDEELNDEGNLFAAAYFDVQVGPYVNDYEEALASNLDTLYHVADTWENYDKLAAIIDTRYTQWKAGNLGPTGGYGSLDKPWWKFW